MAEASGSLTFEDIYNEVIARKYSIRSGATAPQIAEAKVIANLGYRTFLAERDWAFLEKNTTQTAWVTETSTADGQPVYDAAAYSAVTVDDADTFHPSMIGHDLVFTATGNSYEIYGYTSGTVVDVVGDASAEADPDTVTVTSNGIYRLPDDYGEPKSDWIHFAAGEQKTGLEKRPPELIREMRGRDNATAENPWAWGLEAVQSYAEGHQRYDMLVYPAFASEETIQYAYRVNSAAMSAAGDYPAGGMKHCMTVLAAAIKALEEDNGNLSKLAAGKYDRALAISIARDAADKPRNLGYCGDRSDLAPLQRDRGTVTYP